MKLVEPDSAAFTHGFRSPGLTSLFPRHIVNEETGGFMVFAFAHESFINLYFHTPHPLYLLQTQNDGGALPGGDLPNRLVCRARPPCWPNQPFDGADQTLHYQYGGRDAILACRERDAAASACF